MRFFVTTDNILYLHEGIRLLYTTCRYLQDVVLENTCFHVMPPLPAHPLKKIPTAAVELPIIFLMVHSLSCGTLLQIKYVNNC